MLPIILLMAAIQLAPPTLTLAQSYAIDGLLESYAGWRVVMIDDSANPFVKELVEYDPNWHPYFVSADFNRDGSDDFAVMIMGRGDDDEQLFALYWFPASEDGFGPPRFLVSASFLNDGALYWTGEELMIGPPYSDDIFVTFAWDDEKGNLESVPYDPNDWD